MRRKREPNSAPALPLGPALEFLRRVWQFDHALEQLSSRMDKRIGITARQRLILRVVGRYPGIGSGQLAEVLAVDPGTVSASLKRLESRGLLLRRNDPSDGRRVTVSLTAAGQALNRPMAGTVEAAVERLLRSGHADDVAGFDRTLDRLTRELSRQIDD